MHQIGKRMTNELLRSDNLVNKKIVDFWDFDQSGVSLVQQQPHKMKKGDNENYRTTCYYDSHEGNTFGLESHDEMCMTFWYYHPKQPFFYGYGLEAEGRAMQTMKTAFRSISNFGRFGKNESWKSRRVVEHGGYSKRYFGCKLIHA